MIRPAAILQLLLCLVISLSVAIFAVSAKSQEAKPDASPQPGQTAPEPLKSSSAAAPSDAVQNPLGDAGELARKGDCDGAIKKYQEVLQERPKSPDAYAGITRCYLKKKDVTQAFETVSKALQVSDAWPVRVAAGEVYFRQGKIPQAEKEWVEVINSGHQAARAYLGLSRVRRAISMYKSAKAMIEKAHELDPQDPDIQRAWIGTLPRSERIKSYEDYLANPNNSDAEERAYLETSLSYLKERAKRHEPSCRLVSKVQNTEAPLVRMLIDPTHLRGYGLAVNLNGVRTNILLDTGASGIVIKRQTAEKAGITRITETRIWGVGDKGKKDAYIGTAQSIRIGELEFQNCPVEVVESRSVVGEDGVIGAFVFNDFLVDIDFPDEKLKLSALPKRPGTLDKPLALKNEEGETDIQEDAKKTEEASPDDARNPPAPPKSSGPQDRYIASEMQSFTHVYRFGHELLIPTKVGDGPEKLFLLETASVDNAITPTAAREVTKVSGDPSASVKGLSGSVKDVYVADHTVLTFGNLRQHNQYMTSFDTTSFSDHAGTEISGFLGFTMLRLLDIKIDYRDGLVDFTYNPKSF